MGGEKRGEGVSKTAVDDSGLFITHLSELSLSSRWRKLEVPGDELRAEELGMVVSVLDDVVSESILEGEKGHVSLYR